MVGFINSVNGRFFFSSSKLSSAKAVYQVLKPTRILSMAVYHEWQVFFIERIDCTERIV